MFSNSPNIFSVGPTQSSIATVLEKRSWAIIALVRVYEGLAAELAVTMEYYEEQCIMKKLFAEQTQGIRDFLFADAVVATQRVRKARIWRGQDEACPVYFPCLKNTIRMLNIVQRMGKN